MATKNLPKEAFNDGVRKAMLIKRINHLSQEYNEIISRRDLWEFLEIPEVIGE